MAEALRSVTDEVDDPRTGNATLHPLENIIFIGVYAVVCGADTWVHVAEFGKSKRDWLAEFLDLSNGIPSHDTFGRVFGLIEPDQLRRCFLKWSRTLVEGHAGLISIDGKTLRRSFEADDPQSALHTVAAWVDDHDVLLMGPGTRDSDELAASLDLVDMLELEGTTVTYDALGCQHKMVKRLYHAEADYLLRVRGNQESLQDAIIDFFEWQLGEHPDDQHIELDYVEDVDGGHGRVEERRLWCTHDIDWLETDRRWLGLEAIACLESVRHVDGETETMRRYYICSDDDASAEEMLDWARRHWGVENKAHWVLDVAMDEDQSRVRQNHAAENLAMIRRMTMNL
ncbi:MAG: ISAs1 family transposase, partial [Persicimonas sp.]